MKKILFAFAAAVALFASCNQNDNTPVVEFALTDQMVAVGNENVSDANIIVDGTNVYIEIPYENKAELAALEVIFENLPEGVAVEDLTFDFSQGATAQVTFTKQSTDFVYTVSAVAAQPNPRFSKVELTYAGADEASSEDDVTSVAGSDLVVKFKSGTALNALKLAYEVLPAGTKVYKDGVEVAQNAVIDFSATDGVKFTLKCENVEKEYTVKAVTTGISTITRLWGRYGKPETVEANWYDLETTGIGGLGNYRNVAMDANYVYMPKAGAPEVNVINAKTGEFVKQLNVDGIAGGVHLTSAVQVADNAGSSVVLVSNLVNAKDSHLKVYAWTDLNAAPTVALDYVLPDAYRFGDKFQLEGNWTSGRLVFVSYAGTTDRPVAIFDINAGVINPEPTIVKIGNVAKAANSIGGLYRYSDTEYVWAGTGDLFVTYNVANGAFTQNYVCADGGRFSHPMQDLNFFTFNDQNYVAYARLLNSYQDGAIRFQEVNGATIAETMTSVDTSKDKQHILGDPDPEKSFVTADKNTNGCAGCDVYQAADGTTYVVGLVTGSGLSVFELK